MYKYGTENFDFQIIDMAESKEDLDVKEIYWIKELNAMIPQGYNIREGGSRGLLAKSSKQKISKANKGRFVGENNPGYGRTGAKNPLYGKIGPNKGKVLSDSQKQLLSDKMKGLKRSEENKKNSSLAAKRRWEKDREDHLLRKGHIYDLVRMSNGNIRCRTCKNEAERRRYREIQRIKEKGDKKKKR